MDHDRQDDGARHSEAELRRVLETLEDALAGLDDLDLKIVAARLSLVIEEVRDRLR